MMARVLLICCACAAARVSSAVVDQMIVGSKMAEMNRIIPGVFGDGGDSEWRS